jgi:signal transduction histidine kinase
MLFGVPFISLCITILIGVILGILRNPFSSTEKCWGTRKDCLLLLFLKLGGRSTQTQYYPQPSFISTKRNGCDRLYGSVWDEGLLKHILSKLLNNAIKYSPAGGQVRFELTAQEKVVTLQIQDQGIGIPKAEQAQLFQPFFRAHNADRIPGTGLGLAIVKKCVAAHGGEIALQSEVGLGTTFTVTLPLVKGIGDLCLMFMQSIEQM